MVCEEKLRGTRGKILRRLLVKKYTAKEQMEKCLEGWMRVHQDIKNERLVPELEKAKEELETKCSEREASIKRLAKK